MTLVTTFNLEWPLSHAACGGDGGQSSRNGSHDDLQDDFPYIVLVVHSVFVLYHGFSRFIGIRNNPFNPFNPWFCYTISWFYYQSVQSVQSVVFIIQFRGFRTNPFNPFNPLFLLYNFVVLEPIRSIRSIRGFYYTIS